MVPARTAGGFTLLELIVVVFLTGLIYALAAPALGSRSAGLDVRTASSQLAAGLRKARTLAVSERRESVLTLDVGGKAFSVGDDPRRYALPAPLELALFTAQSELVRDQAGSIRFYPDGTSTGGRISVAAGGVRQIVDVDWITGRVTVE